MTNKILSTVSAIALSASMAAGAIAAPASLTDSQMDRITAGQEPAAFATVAAMANNGTAMGTFALTQGLEFSSASITGTFVNNQPNPNNFFALMASVQNQ